MLKVPDKRTRNLLDLADMIEKVEPDWFKMGSWQHCICGHYLKSKGITYIGQKDWEDLAAPMLDLTVEQASELFAPDGADKNAIMLHTPKEAAERIRKFAFRLAD